MSRLRLIRFRLTLTYTLLLTIAFTLFSVGLSVGLQQILYNNFNTKLNNAADSVVKASKVTAQFYLRTGYPNFGLAFHVDSETIGGDVNPSTTKFAFVDPNGRLIPGDKVGDPKLASNPKVKAAISKSLTQGSKQNVTVKSTSGDANMLVVPITTDTGAAEYVLLVQSSLQDVEDTLSLLQRILLLTAIAATLLSATGAWFLTGRVLRPIDQISEKVRKITARDLSQRLNINQADEIGRMAGTFDDMIGRLQASFERQKRFTSDASHELRTPLTVMQADISLALKRPRSTVEYRRTLESAQEEVVRLSGIVSDLLTLARYDTDTAQIAHEPVSLDEVIEGVVAGLRPLASDKHISLTFAGPGPVALLGDATRLKQVFVNLIDNAIAYTPEGGSIHVVLSTSEDIAEISVQDSGIGIQSQHLPHIFERFYRAEEARTHNHEGTGLGLAIAQSAAQAHRGRIEATSIVGHGTTFRVYLPLKGPVPIVQDEGGRLGWLAMASGGH